MEEAELPPLISVLSLLLFSLESIPWNIISSALVILFLLLFSALISGSETAFFSLNRKILEDTNEHKKTKSIKYLLKKPKKLLATILITNNFVNVAIVVLFYYFLNDLFHIDSLHPIVQFLLEVVLITSFILLFGEIIPKIYAAHKPFFFATIMASPLCFLSKLFTPLSSALVNSTNLIDKSLKKKKKSFDKEEITDALALTTNHKEHHQERKMIEGIVKFGDIEVSEVMKSRVDMVALDSTTAYSDVIETIIEFGFSRIPVYQESLDHIIGVLVTKSLLEHLDKGEDFQWQQQLHPPIFVPETKKISALLEELRNKKIHLAIVVDEYGGTMGLVTMEDILEEIIGEFYDEKDVQNEDVEYQQINKNTYIFEGKTNIIDFLKILSMEDDSLDEVKKESETIAGLLLENLGAIPQKNTKLSFPNLTFEVISVDKRRIKKIKVIVKQ